MVYGIAGTEGAELYSGLDIVSDYCYDKYVGDALTNKALFSSKAFLQEDRFF